MAARRDSARDFIVVPAGTYTLTAPVGSTTFGLPAVGNNITIQGAGADQTVIERASGAGTPDFGVFQVTGSGFVLRDLTVRNGSLPTGSGGGLSTRDGAVTVERVVFDGNHSGNGGAYSDFNGGLLTAVDSTFVGNGATSGGAVAAVGTLVLRGDAFLLNTATAGGGAVSAHGAVIEDSRFSGNIGLATGGAIPLSQSSTLTRVTLRGNVTKGSGGAISTSGPMTLVDSTVDGNRGERAGGVMTGSGAVTVAGSTFSHNEATVGVAGALDVEGGGSLVNSTFSGNTSRDLGGAVYVGGGGTLAVNNVTVTGNTSIGREGGGLYQGGATIVIANSIVAGNTSLLGWGHDVRRGGGTWTWTGYDLVGVGDNANVTFAPTDLVGSLASPLDPGLAPLSAAGGPTAFHRLRAGSPARDAGNPGTPGSGAGACAATDQRGRPRPGAGGAACDIGAVETDTASGADLSIAKVASSSVAYLGQPVTFTVTVANDGDADAGAVTVTDALPVGLSLVSATPAQGTCDVTGDTATCALGTLASGASADIDVVATPTVLGSLENTAALAADTGVPEGGATASASIVVKTPIQVTSFLQSPGDPGDCTIGEAIQAANTDRPVDGCAAGSGADLILVPAGLYLLDHPEVPTGDVNGLPIVTSDLTIEGAPAGGTAIERVPASVPFGIFAVSNAPQFTLRSVVVRHGNRGTIDGGAIRTHDNPVRLDRDVFEDNTGVNGGAYADGNGGNLTIVDSTFSSNHATGAGGAVRSVGPVRILRSTFNTNDGPASGGGVSAQGVADISDSLFIANTTHSNGAGLATGLATLRRTVLRNNVADGEGGGISSAGILTILDSTIDGNRGYSGGGVRYGASGNALLISGTTISGNEAVSSVGGGLKTSGGGLIVSSTLSGNRSANNGGALWAEGSPSLTLRHVTITGNTATGGWAGGVSFNSGTITLANTIVAGNTNPNSPDIRPLGGTVASLGHNLIGNDTNSTVTFDPSDLVGHAGSPLDPMLGPLANNGGFTETHELRAGSPAIDAGDAANCVPFDQRGVVRPQGPACDIGAFERTIDATTADVSVTITASPDPAEAGHDLTYTITARNDGPADASAVNVTVTLPAGATMVSAAATQGIQSQPADHVLFHLGTLSSGASATMMVVVTPTTLGTADATAVLTAAEPDPDTSDLTVAVSTVIAPSSELRVDGVAPNRGGDRGVVQVDIAGVGFAAGTTMRLVRPGEPDIEGVPPSVGPNGLTLQTTFDSVRRGEGFVGSGRHASRRADRDASERVSRRSRQARAPGVRDHRVGLDPARNAAAVQAGHQQHRQRRRRRHPVLGERADVGVTQEGVRSRSVARGGYGGREPGVDVVRGPRR